MFKNRIQTCCEIPNVLLDKNHLINDYDFVLFHLYISDETYREYYLSMRKFRTIILDNSAYEFHIKGEELDMDKFIEVIQELRPHYALLPDVLMDVDKTIKLVDECLNIKMDEYMPEWIAVLQGNSLQDFYKCLAHYKSKGISNIAIPFHNSFFKGEMYDLSIHIPHEWRLKFGSITDDMKYAIGRIESIRILRRYLSSFDRIHFLGSHNPWEKIYLEEMLKDHNGTVSMDTGYPTKVGIQGYNLFEEPCKPNIIIDDFLNDYLTDEIKEKIVKNIEIFRSL
jgi:hypothetical protein